MVSNVPSTTRRQWWLRESPDLPVQYFGGAHRGRVCVRVFIEMWVCMRCECLRCTVCSKKIVSSADLWDSKYSKRKSIGVEYPSQSSTSMFICQCPSTIVIIYLWAIQLLNWWLMRLLQSSCQASQLEGAKKISEVYENLKTVVKNIFRSLYI